jgi:hypothetical protein
MPGVRETIVRFIESEGHKVDAAPSEATDGVSELLFRARGQVFSVTTDERRDGSFSVSTAYEIPEWARERQQNVDVLERVGKEHPDITFSLAHDGNLFVATLDEEAGSPQAFMQGFWLTVARVREAGSRAIEEMVDRTESKAAAEKFINSFMRGER